MKAVIVECSKGAAVALCDDGTFCKIKNRGYLVGQELSLKKKAYSGSWKRTLSLCASLAVALLSLGGIGAYMYVTPYTYVSLDINPSISYSLNRYDKVIEVRGMNDDGQQVVSSISSEVSHRSISDALGVTIRQLEKDHYISDEDNHVIIGICSDNEKKVQTIVSCVDTLSQEEAQVCSIDTVTVSAEVKNDADSLGITPGKLALINAVAQSSDDENFNYSDWTDKTVAELETTLREAEEQSGAAAEDAKEIPTENSDASANTAKDGAVQTDKTEPDAAAAAEDGEATVSETENTSPADESTHSAEEGSKTEPSSTEPPANDPQGADSGESTKKDAWEKETSSTVKDPEKPAESSEKPAIDAPVEKPQGDDPVELPEETKPEGKDADTGKTGESADGNTSSPAKNGTDPTSSVSKDAGASASSESSKKRPSDTAARSAEKGTGSASLNARSNDQAVIEAKTITPSSIEIE